MFIQVCGVLSALSIFTPIYVVVMRAKVRAAADAGYPLPLLTAHLSIRWCALTQISEKQQNAQQRWREV